MALALDGFVGEPPAWLHPVVWMGRVLAWFETRAPSGEGERLAYGVATAVGLPLAWGLFGRLIEVVAPWPLQAVALKPTFAGRALLTAGERVEHALERGQLEVAVAELPWLVSRPTAGLDTGLVASAAIESLAENLVDSWLAPLVAYALFGLGGAYAYRAANTADAMWGYRSPEYEHLGKATARLDDVLNWVPARFSALLLAALGPRPVDGLAIWRRDAGLTASPNAGQVMAMAAGLLDVRLEKPAHYVLHRGGLTPTARDIAAARHLVYRAMLASAVLCLVAIEARRR
jgi:adenosylcobinamide-phosphate synthase